MTSDPYDLDHEGRPRWASARSLRGALQRGLGRGARQAEADPDAWRPVFDCVRLDRRREPLRDQREVYFARLVRDLALPVAPIAAWLRDADAIAEWSDYWTDTRFDLAMGVLEVAARAGVDAARDEVRRYIATGPRWVTALQAVAGTWPVDWWDDLYTTARRRLDRLPPPSTPPGPWERPRWTKQPWISWASRDERIAAEVRTAAAQVSLVDAHTGGSTSTLLALLGTLGRGAERSAVLRELRRRPADPTVLDRLEGLGTAVAAEEVAGVALSLGAPALRVARRWSATPGHPLRRAGIRLLAAHGDDADVPRLLAELDRLDAAPRGVGDRYDLLVTGLARIGGSAAATIVPRLRRLWLSPWSSERAGYLWALHTLDPHGAPAELVEALWDCEADVRLLGARWAPLDDVARSRLRYLHEDPIELAAVRAAAAARLT